MSWPLLGALAVVTLASRVLPMALLPTPRGRVAVVLDALPAPLFAGLAVHALLGDRTSPTGPELLAAGAALLGATRRSLALTLVCGVAGFTLGEAVLG